MLTDTDRPRLSLVPEPTRTSIESMLTPSMYPNGLSAKPDYTQATEPQGAKEGEQTKRWTMQEGSTLLDISESILESNGGARQLFAILCLLEGMEVHQHGSAVDHSMAPFLDDVPETFGQTYSFRIELPAQAPTTSERLDLESVIRWVDSGRSRILPMVAKKSLRTDINVCLHEAEIGNLQELQRMLRRPQHSHVLALAHGSGGRHIVRSILSEAEGEAARGDKACAAILGNIHAVIEILERRGWQEHLFNLMLCLGQLCATCPVVLYQPASLTHGDPLASHEHTSLGRHTGENLLAWCRKSIQGLLLKVSVLPLLLCSRLTCPFSYSPLLSRTLSATQALHSSCSPALSWVHSLLYNATITRVRCGSHSW
jgi:hypothetical protein